MTNTAGTADPRVWVDVNDPEPAHELVAFLSARLDEDEANATQALALWPDTHFTIDPGSLVLVEFHRRRDPARVLREVQPKRTLLRYFSHPAEDGHLMHTAIAATIDELAHGKGTMLPTSWILREMATAWNDHPDYRTEWRP